MTFWDDFWFGTWCNEFLNSPQCNDGIALCTCSPILPPMIIYLPIFIGAGILFAIRMFTNIGAVKEVKK